MKIERLYVHSILTLIFNWLNLKCFLWNIIAALYMNTRRSERVSTEETHCRHAETLQQYFLMKIPTQCVYVSLHQHFSNKPGFNKNHFPRLLCGRKLDVKVPVLQARFSAVYGFLTQYHCRSCPKLRQHDVWELLYFPRKLLSREYNMSLWKAAND